MKNPQIGVWGNKFLQIRRIPDNIQVSNKFIMTYEMDSHAGLNEFTAQSVQSKIYMEEG